MRMSHAVLPMLFVCGFLAGCGGPPNAADKSAAKDASSDAGGAAATPANLALTTAGAPQRRDGYWEMASFTDTGSPMTKQFLCVGAGSESKYSVFDQLASAGECSKKDFTRTATGWTFETRCKVMSYETVQKGTISGDFQQSYRIDQAVTQTPSTTENKGSIRGKRIGDCPAKYKPGDLVDKDGDKLGNMLGA
ncbi:MAG: hypothetical protein JWO83_2510 [Caulobacteraceae bacterium]|nr:hypothetical protein [Caulobacteraceae bacterium]